MVKNNLNPTWKPFRIPLQSLCGGDMDKPIKVLFYSPHYIQYSILHWSLSDCNSTLQHHFHSAPHSPLITLAFSVWSLYLFNFWSTHCQEGSCFHLKSELSNGSQCVCLHSSHHHFNGWSVVDLTYIENIYRTLLPCPHIGRYFKNVYYRTFLPSVPPKKWVVGNLI